MKIRSLIRPLLLAALITSLLLSAGIAWFNASSGPRFQGRPADAWLRDLGSSDHGVRSDAAVAVTHLGTDGLPAIRRLLRGEGDWFPAPVRQLAEDCLSLRLPGLPAPELRSCGAVACSLLGPDAAPLLPELLRLLEDKPEAAPAYALAALGRPAVEPLIRQLASEQVEVRIWSTFAVGRLLIRNPDAFTAPSTVAGDSSPTLRSLRSALELNIQHPHPRLRYVTDWAMERLDHPSAPPAPEEAALAALDFPQGGTIGGRPPFGAK